MTKDKNADEVELRHKFQTLAEESDQGVLASQLYHENSKQIQCDIGFYKRITYFNNSDLGFQLVQRAAKAYACAIRVPLPPPLDQVPLCVAEAIMRRKSTRQFGGEPLSLTELATLLKFANGVLDRTRDEPLPRRAIPSGGGLYPTELYVLPLNIPNLEAGAYHYDVFEHSLARFVDAPAEAVLGRTCYTDLALPTASVAFAISACFGRQEIKYGERAYRFTLMECGHLAQNVLLMGIAMGLGALPVGGFLDDEINSYLQLDGRQEAVLYLILMGSLPPVQASSSGSNFS